MMIIPEWIIQLIGIASVGAAAAAAIFVFFGKRWISHLFAKELEQEKAELTKQLEQAKSEISFYAAKRLTLHNKEYDVFPEIWSRLSDAKSALQNSLMEFRSMPDIDRMTKDDLKAWIVGIDIDEDEKNAIIGSNERMKLFNRILDYRRLRDAEEKFHEFQDYFQKQRIFLSPDVRGKFDEIKGLLRKAWAAKTTDVRLNGQGSQDFFSKALDIFNDEVEPLMKEIEDIIQGKLFPERENQEK